MAMFADWTLAELKEKRLALERALVSPRKSIAFADRNMTMESKEEMRKVLALLADAIAEREGATAPARRIQLGARSGWCG